PRRTPKTSVHQHARTPTTRQPTPRPALQAELQHPARNNARASSSSGRLIASVSERRIGNQGSSLPQRTRPRYVLVFMKETRFGSMYLGAYAVHETYRFDHLRM